MRVTRGADGPDRCPELDPSASLDWMEETLDRLSCSANGIPLELYHRAARTARVEMRREESKVSTRIGADEGTALRVLRPGGAFAAASGGSADDLAQRVLIRVEKDRVPTSRSRRTGVHRGRLYDHDSEVRLPAVGELVEWLETARAELPGDVDTCWVEAAATLESWVSTGGLAATRVCAAAAGRSLVWRGNARSFWRGGAGVDCLPRDGANCGTNAGRVPAGTEPGRARFDPQSPNPRHRVVSALVQGRPTAPLSTPRRRPSGRDGDSRTGPGRPDALFGGDVRRFRSEPTTEGRACRRRRKRPGIIASVPGTTGVRRSAILHTPGRQTSWSNLRAESAARTVFERFECGNSPGRGGMDR